MPGGPQNAYDPVLRALMHESAVKHSIRYTDGVFLSNLGPSFETPAEIKAYRVRGPGHACPARPAVCCSRGVAGASRRLTNIRSAPAADDGG